jgi:streptogramin lyase
VHRPAQGCNPGRSLGLDGIVLKALSRQRRHAVVRFTVMKAHMRHAVLVCWMLAVPAIAAAEERSFSIAPVSVDTVAGNGQPGDLLSDGGTARDVPLDQPFGVEIGPGGPLYITSVGQHRVLRLDPSSDRLTSVAGNGTKGYSGDGGAATAAQLNEPYEVRFARDGTMYFVEMQNHLVRRVRADGTISTVAGTGQPGYAGDDSSAATAQFRQPHSIALDDRGHLYVADIGNHRIRRIDLEAGTITSIAGNGERSLPRRGEVAKGQPIFGPRALAVTGRTLWIALREGNSVWRMSLDTLVIEHVAGSGDKGYSGDGGPAALATFNGPKGIAVGPDGFVDLVDTENQVIRRIDAKAGTITTIAGSGPEARGFAGDGGRALAAQFDRPHGICVAPDGTIYVGDTNNHRVRRLTWQRP